MIVDVSDPHAQLEADFKHAMRKLDKDMLAAVRNGATFERRFKTYKDRTGNLKRSTRGYLAPALLSDGEKLFVLEMGEDYATFVDARGFSKIKMAQQFTKQAMDQAVRDAELISSG